jgi:hypothetical protein
MQGLPTAAEDAGELDRPAGSVSINFSGTAALLQLLAGKRPCALTVFVENVFRGHLVPSFRGG